MQNFPYEISMQPREYASSILSMLCVTLLQLASKPVFAEVQKTPAGIAAFDSALSADAKVRVFVSDQAGNLDVFIQTSQGQQPRMISSHPSDDFSPALSRNGKKIAFVSRRDDSLGDVYVMNVGWSLWGALLGPEKAMLRIAREKWEDRDPVFAAKNQTLYFATRPAQSSKFVLAKYEFGTERVEVLDRIVGEQPAPTPDGRFIALVRNGKIFIHDVSNNSDEQVTLPQSSLCSNPSYAPESDFLYMSCRFLDSNRDGVLTVEDAGTIMRVRIDPQSGKPLPGLAENLTSYTEDANYPVISAEVLEFSMIRQGSQRIFGLDAHNLLNESSKSDRLTSYNGQAGSVIEESRRRTFLASKSSEMELDMAALDEIDLVTTHGSLIDVEHTVERIKLIRGATKPPVVEAQVAWKLRSADELLFPKKLNGSYEEESLKRLEQEVSGISGSSDHAGWTKIAAARIALTRGRVVESRKYLREILDQNSKRTVLNSYAEFLLVTSSQLELGDETTIRRLPALLRKYPQSVWLRDSVGAHICRLMQNVDTPQSLVDSIKRDLSQDPLTNFRFARIAADCARLKSDVGREESELKDALAVDSVSVGPQERAIALWRLTEILIKNNRSDDADAEVRKFERSISSEKSADLQSVRQKIAAFWRQRAAKLVRINEPGIAAKRYEEAILKNDQDIEAHRGYIDSMARRGETKRVVYAYQTRFADRPSAIHRYYYGLATSYLADISADPDEKNQYLRIAANEIEAAMASDSSNPYIHQTLGWIYHQMSVNASILEQEQQKRSTAGRLAASISSVFYPKEEGLLKMALREYELADQLADPESAQKIVIAQNLAETYAQLGNPRKSLFFAVKRLREIDTVPFSSDEQSASFYLLTARSAFDSDQLELSAEINKEAIAQFETSSRKPQLVVSLELLALTMRELLRFDEALKLYDRLEQLYGLQDPETSRNNQLNRAYCLTKLGRDDEALQLLDGAEISLRADSNLMAAPRKINAVVIALDKKTASYGRFDNFMRLLLVISLRIEMAERNKQFETVRKLWKTKYELMQEKRVNALSTDYPKEYLTYELALAGSALGYLATKSASYVEAVQFFEESQRWLEIFLKGEAGSDESELKLAKNLTIAISAAIKAEEMTAESQGERLKKVQELTQKFVDRAIQQSLPKPPLAIEVMNLVGDARGIASDYESGMELQEDVDQQRIVQEATESKTTEIQQIRADRNALFGDQSRSWQYMALRGHWKLAAEELKSALENNMTFGTLDTRRKALEVVDHAVSNMVSDSEVALTELSRWGDLWAAEILRRTGTSAAVEVSKSISENEPWAVESLKSVLDRGSAMILVFDVGSTLRIVCTDGRSSLMLTNLDEKSDNPCGNGFEATSKWYIVPIAGSMRAAKALADQLSRSANEFRYLPFPSSIFSITTKKGSALERAVIVSHQNNDAVGSGLSIEVKWVKPEDEPVERSLMLGIEGKLVCQPKQSSTARFGFKNLDEEVPAFETVHKWAKGANNLIMRAAGCVDSGQIMEETWVAVSAVAISQGVRGVYFLTDEKDKDADTGDNLIDLIDRLASRKNSVGESVRKFTFAIGAFPETTEEYQAIANEKLGEVTDEMFDAFDNRDYAGASSLASILMGYASVLTDSTAWNEAADIAVRSRFALGDFNGALYLQKSRISKLSEATPLSERIAFNISALAIAIKASSQSDAIFYRDQVLKMGETNLNPEQVRELARYQALIDQMSNDYQAAVKSYLNARELSRSQNDQVGVVERDLDIGNVYREFLSDYPKAIEFYHRALSTASQTKIPELQTRILIDYANTLIATGQVFEAIELLDPWAGKLNAGLSKLSKLRLNQVRAVAHYQAGVFQRAKDINDNMLAELVPGRDFEIEAIRLDAETLKAMLEGRFGDIPQAIRTLEQGIERAMEMRLYSRASTRYNNLGYWSREAGNFEVASAYFEKALEIDRRHRIKSGEAFDLRNLAYTIMKMGQFDRAKSLFEQSMINSNDAGLAINKIHVLLGLGEILMKEKKFQQAEMQFEDALKIANQGGIRDLAWRAYGAIASSAIAQSRYETAKDKLSEATKIIESIRTGLSSVSSRSGFLAEASVQNIYERAIDVHMHLKNPTEAWQISERARSRAFIDSLGTQRSLLTSGEESRILSEEMRLRSAIAVSAKDDVEKLRREYQELIQKMRDKYPRLMQLSNVQAINLDELKEILPREVILIEYMVTEVQTHIWAIGHDVQAAHSVAYGRSEIEDDLGKLQMAMKNITNADTLLQKMGEKLIGKLAPIVAGAKRAVIVPHGPLHHLPFAALTVDQGKRLLDILPIHYLESATLAKFVYGVKDPSKSNSVVALGNPERGAAMELPFAKREVEAIGRSMKQSRVFSGKAATESNFKRFASNANFIHVASHGEFNLVQPMDSRLLLTADEKDDGNLSAAEIFGLHLKNTTVVLSACETGLGRVSQGDEIIGMNRAFLYAGARSLISSLWRISDVASAVLMKRFYRGVAAGLEKDAALRQAQLAVKSRYGHPAYWAPMRLIGSYY